MVSRSVCYRRSVDSLFFPTAQLEDNLGCSIKERQSSWKEQAPRFPITALKKVKINTVDIIILEILLSRKKFLRKTSKQAAY